MVTKVFTASITQEGEWFIAQCHELDIASQGETVDEALENLKEAIQLLCEEPIPTAFPRIVQIEVPLCAA